MRFFVESIESGWFNAYVYFESIESLTVTYLQASNIMNEDYITNIFKMCKNAILMKEGYSNALLSNELTWKLLSFYKENDDQYTFTIYQLDDTDNSEDKDNVEDMDILEDDILPEQLSYKFRFEQKNVDHIIFQMFIESVVDAFTPYATNKREEYEEHWCNNYSNQPYTFPYEEFQFLKEKIREWRNVM